MHRTGKTCGTTFHSESTAAIYVITNEDLRCSGATSIAEALKLAPGMTVPHTVLPSLPGNNAYGNSYGFEAVVEAPAAGPLALHRVIQLSRSSNAHAPRSTESNADRSFENSPLHLFQIRSMLDLPKNVQLDMGVRYVDAHPRGTPESYWQTDVRVGWMPLERLDISLIGQNMIDDRHPEAPLAPFEVQRSAFVRITLKF